VLTYNGDAGTATVSHGWSSGSPDPQPQDTYEISLSEIPEAVERHRGGRSHVATEGEGFADDWLRGRGIAPGTVRMVTVPMLSGGACTGSVAFGFDRNGFENSPTEQEVGLLRVFAGVLIRALEHRKAADSARQAQTNCWRSGPQ
jgi:hypothetical protein